MKHAAAIACLLSLSACRDGAPNTQIVISVDTNYAVPSGLDAVAFKVEKQNSKGYDPPRHDDVERLDGKNAPQLPLTLALTSVASGRPTVRVTVTGQRDGKDVLTRQAIVGFRSGQTLSLPMNLVLECEGKVCGEGETCGEGGLCGPIERGALSPWQGEAPELDASVPDAAASDASAPDAGPVDSARIRHLAVGFHHSCALLASGRVACWGGNAGRELGAETQPSDCEGQAFACSPNPQLVQGVEDAVQITAGERFSCALTGSGEVYCWGSNSNGQIGGGTPTGGIEATRVRLQTDPSKPTVLLSGVDRVVAGRYHACARLADTHGLVCWGGEPNEHFQIPVAGEGTNIAVPTNITSGVEQLAMGYFHGCFIDAMQALWCWGANENGQLGSDPQALSASLEPRRVIARGVTAVAAGGAHTCALVDGSVSCFGLASSGQLGFGLLPEDLPVCSNLGVCTAEPSLVDRTIMSAATALSLGDIVSCARYANGRVGCWGSGNEGAVGLPGESAVLSPTYLPDPRNVRLLAAFAGHECIAVEGEDDEVYCWGANTEGQLGPNATIGQWQVDLATVTLDRSF